jgi:electron transfer flavoprotein alpha subunit
MRIAVCVKQVPVLSALQFDPNTRTLKREGVPSEVSAFDVRAVIKAVDVRSAHGGEVVVITMGPPQARDALTYCLALGADRAIHLCDRAFAGSDTLATARALACVLARESFDLILCGRNSVDAETGQVGPEVAGLLDLPQVSSARTLVIDPVTRHLTAERETDDGFETVVAPLPALVTAAEDLAPERFPSKAEREAATTRPCVEMHAADLSSDLAQFGVAGSPTAVVGLQQVATARVGRIIQAASADDAAAAVSQLLVGEHGLFGTWKVAEQPPIAQVAPAPQRTGAAEVWVLGEQAGDTLRPVTVELLGKAAVLARALNSRVSALLLGQQGERHAVSLTTHGADRVLLANHAALSPYQAEPHADVLVGAIRTYAPGIILIPATAMGRDLAARVAARLGLGLTGDCVDLGLDAQGRLLQYKPAFGGSVVAPIVSHTLPEMATVRPGMLPVPQPDRSKAVAIEQLQVHEPLPSRTRIISRCVETETALDLDSAQIVIGVGMGLGDQAHLAAVQPLARLLGAALCTTRDVTDAGWLPKQYQVGLTGRAIAPKLYIAIGIRGAFEHLVGVRNAGLIVAINKNVKAPIFKGADYGIVGDYTEVVPALCRHLSTARTHSRTD